MADHRGLHLNPVIRSRTLTESVRLQMQGINATDRANGLISQPSARSPTTSDAGATCETCRQASEHCESGTSSQRAIVSTHNFIVCISCGLADRPTDFNRRYNFYDLFRNGATLLRLLIRERQTVAMTWLRKMLAKWKWNDLWKWHFSMLIANEEACWTGAVKSQREWHLSFVILSFSLWKLQLIHAHANHFNATTGNFAIN